MEDGRRFIILLYETGTGTDTPVELGYWDGKTYTQQDEQFPGVLDNKFDPLVKRYKSKKSAHNAAARIQEELVHVELAEVETILLSRKGDSDG